jgi:hypothetical protein
VATLTKADALRVWRGMPRWWKLAALCVSANLAEVGLVVLGLGHGAGAALAPQASAVAPFGVFADLRWVSVYDNSWLVFVGEMVAVLVLRSALTAASVAWAWPGHLPGPSARTLMRRGAVATAVSAALVSPSVVLLFASAVAPVSWLFLAAVPLAVLVAFIAHPVGVSNDWWKRPPPLRALGWLVLVFVAMSLAGSATAATPSWLWPLVGVLSGLFNAWSWRRLVGSLVERRPARYIVPVVPLAALALVGGVVGGTVAALRDARGAGAVEKPFDGPAITGAQAVLLVSGYGSSWDGQAPHPLPGDFLEEEFSYRGLSPAGEPLPYSGVDTVKPLPELERMFLAQLRSLDARTGQKVDVVAESEGALVAKTALLGEPGSPAPVATLVLASPLEAPDRVSYPVSGGHGWGVASDAAMEVMSDALQGVSPVVLSPRSAFLASLDAEAPELVRAMSCPIPGTRQFLLLPLADATVVPPAGELPFPSAVVPAFHGGLIEDPSADKVLAEVLSGRPVRGDGPLRLVEQAVSYVASAWQVPSLVPSDYAAVLSANGTPSCAAVGAKLHLAVSEAGT